MFVSFFTTECVCNPLGVNDSKNHRTCDVKNGACLCKNKSITGAHCEKCTKESNGRYPNCKWF